MLTFLCGFYSEPFYSGMTLLMNCYELKSTQEKKNSFSFLDNQENSGNHLSVKNRLKILFFPFLNIFSSGSSCTLEKYFIWLEKRDEL